MLDFGWSEFLLCLIVAVFAIGPKQIPDVLYWIGRVVRRVQYMRFALSAQMDDLLNLSEIEKLRNEASLKTAPATSADDERFFDEDDDGLIPPPTQSPAQQTHKQAAHDPNT